MILHLPTALARPLQDLARRILAHLPEIERWRRTPWQEHAVPFHNEVDLRHAGFKLAASIGIEELDSDAVAEPDAA
jgi:Glutamate-cysteine ligase